MTIIGSSEKMFFNIAFFLLHVDLGYSIGGSTSAFRLS